MTGVRDLLFVVGAIPLAWLLAAAIVLPVMFVVHRPEPVAEAPKPRQSPDVEPYIGTVITDLPAADDDPPIYRALREQQLQLPESYAEDGIAELENYLKEHTS